MSAWHAGGSLRSTPATPASHPRTDNVLHTPPHNVIIMDMNDMNEWPTADKTLTLIQRVREGSNEAKELLLDRHRESLRRMIARDWIARYGIASTPAISFKMYWSRQIVGSLSIWKILRCHFISGYVTWHGIELLTPIVDIE